MSTKDEEFLIRIATYEVDRLQPKIIEKVVLDGFNHLVVHLDFLTFPIGIAITSVDDDSSRKSKDIIRKFPEEWAKLTKAVKLQSEAAIIATTFPSGESVKSLFRIATVYDPTIRQSEPLPYSNGTLSVQRRVDRSQTQSDEVD